MLQNLPCMCMYILQHHCALCLHAAGSENIPPGVPKAGGQRNGQGRPKKVPSRKSNHRAKRPLADTATHQDRCKVNNAQTSSVSPSEVHRRGLDLEAADVQSELTARARAVDDLGIPLSLETMVKLACSLVQQPLPPAKRGGGGGGGGSKPAKAAAPSSSVRQNAATLPTAVSPSTNPAPGHRCRDTATLGSDRGRCPSLSAASSVPPLAQASLSLTTGGAFQLTRGRGEGRQRCGGGVVGATDAGPTSAAADARGRRAKAKAAKKRTSPLPTVTSRSIPRYFQQSSLGGKSDRHRKGNSTLQCSHKITLILIYCYTIYLSVRNDAKRTRYF